MSFVFSEFNSKKSSEVSDSANGNKKINRKHFRHAV